MTTFDVAPPRTDVPTLADGLELLGELSGSGYRRAPGLVRRADGQTVQVTPLLYALLGEVDGRRDEAELAERLGARVDRAVTAENVDYLLEHKLRPLGLLRGIDGSSPAVAKANPLLALSLKVVVADPRWTWRLTTPFAWLFSPYVVVPVLLAFAWTVWEVLVEQGLASAARSAIYEPHLLLAIVGLTVISAGFHEFGHAAACRYGGARPGVMGAGLYLVWPAFYTDVDDSYRLSRWGRLRVDLGGLYFNAVVAVGVMATWLVVREDALLLGVLAQLVQMVRQLVPFFRADGYHILADLTGVPDLFAHLRPTLLGLLPSRWGSPQPTPLKRWARVVVTSWVLLTVPVLLGLLTLMVYVLPRLIATAWDSAGMQAASLTSSLGDGDLVAVLARLVSLLALALPVLGISYLLSRIARRTVRRTWQLTDDRPPARAAALLAGALLAVLVAWSWWAAEQYTPLRADERGTLSEAVSSLAAPAAVALEPVAAAEPAPAAAPAAAPVAVRAAIPPAAAPVALGPVAARPIAAPAFARAKLPPAPPVGPTVPRVLRFSLPAAAGVGDNQALALGTLDGRAVYEGAYALVYLTDGSRVANRNGAYALASCTGCSTTAVAFQVVLVVGDARVVVPVNEAVAANDQCLSCVTTAIAVQVVATLDRLPDRAVEAELTRALNRLNGLQGRSRTLSPGALVAEVQAVQAQVLDVLERSGLMTTAPSEATSATAGADGNVATAAEPTTAEPTAAEPTIGPSVEPSAGPDAGAAALPATEPTAAPTSGPAALPATDPTAVPTSAPTDGPATASSAAPTAGPTVAPIADPDAAPEPSPPPQTPEPAVSPTPEAVVRTDSGEADSVDSGELAASLAAAPVQ